MEKSILFPISHRRISDTVGEKEGYSTVAIFSPPDADKQTGTISFWFLKLRLSELHSQCFKFNQVRSCSQIKLNKHTNKKIKNPKTFFCFVLLLLTPQSWCLELQEMVNVWHLRKKLKLTDVRPGEYRLHISNVALPIQWLFDWSVYIRVIWSTAKHGRNEQ